MEEDELVLGDEPELEEDAADIEDSEEGEEESY